MSAHLVIEATGAAAVIAVAFGIRSSARATASVLRVWIEQSHCTRRLRRSLENAEPAERVAIIKACSQLEEKAVGGTATWHPPAHPQDMARVLILHDQPPLHLPRGLTVHEATPSTALSENGLIRSLVELAANLDLDRRNFVIFGSGPLLAHGLRQQIRDLDIVARGPVWRRVCQYGAPATGEINGAPLAVFCGGLIQFSQGWISEDWDGDALIDRGEIVQGLPFAQLTDVLAYKQDLRRPKDLADIQALLAALGRSD
jgi:hypothetical protein